MNTIFRTVRHRDYITLFMNDIFQGNFDNDSEISIEINRLMDE